MLLNVQGPLFDGRATTALSRYARHTEESIGQAVVNRIHTRLGEVIRVNRHIYSSQIHTERQSNDVIVTDTPVVYGPWLEGVGSRNYPVTRFRGYGTFRYVTQSFAGGQAAALAEEELQPYLREMN